MWVIVVVLIRKKKSTWRCDVFHHRGLKVESCQLEFYCQTEDINSTFRHLALEHWESSPTYSSSMAQKHQWPYLWTELEPSRPPCCLSPELTRSALLLSTNRLLISSLCAGEADFHLNNLFETASSLCLLASPSCRSLPFTPFAPSVAPRRVSADTSVRLSALTDVFSLRVR